MALATRPHLIDRLPKPRGRLTADAPLGPQTWFATGGRAEVLFRAGLSPFRSGTELAAEDWSAMWADLRGLMRAGVRANRIDTTAPSDRTRRSGPASRADAHYVYRRAGLLCRVCATEVRTAVMAGRNLFWCPRCQRRG